MNLCTVALAAFTLPCLLTAQTEGKPQGGTATLRTGVQLVAVDVVVTDRSGNPVHGLPQTAFTVQENKADQPIRGFEEHTAQSSAAQTRPPLPRGVFGNAPAVAGGETTVLLLDGLNTPPQAQPYMRDELVKFLAGEKSGVRTAVFTLNTRLLMLQDFSTDPAVLKQVVKMAGVKFSPLLNRELNDSAVHNTSETLTGMIESASDPSMAAMLEGVQQGMLDMDARQRSAQVSVRAQTTMDALRQLGRYLAGIPGRKNVIWFSGSFPVHIVRDLMTTGDPFAGNRDLSEELKRTIDLLAANQVALYPIDARGLEAPPSMSPDEAGSTNLRRTQLTYGTTSATPRDDQFYVDQAQEHSTMNDLADGTGGKAFYNTNGLAQAVAQAERDGESYYTVLYTPPPGAKPGEFRNINVKLNVGGVRLAFRHGYYAESKAALDHRTSTATISNAVANANTPDAGEIHFQMWPQTVTDAAPEKTVGLPLVAKVPHTLYALNVTVDASGVNFQQDAEGKVHASIEFATLLYDSKGKIVASHQDRADLVMDNARYQSMVQGGVRFHTYVALPDDAKGTVRVMVHDATTDRIGSLHLSNAEVRSAVQPLK